MPNVKWELRATSDSLSEIQKLLDDQHGEYVKQLHDQADVDWKDPSLSKRLACKGNQHTCKPTINVPALNKSYELTLTGTGDSEIVGHHLGPRALSWNETELKGHEPDLGDITVTLLASETHAGTLVPLQRNKSLPAINRNTYFFVIDIEKVGKLVSGTPAIVESIINEIPPRSRYYFKNPPINFYLETDQQRSTPLAILTSAYTDVEPK